MLRKWSGCIRTAWKVTTNSYIEDEELILIKWIGHSI